MTVKAYQRTLRVTENPRATEYRLFGQVTGALIEARDRKASGGPLAEALDWNRRVWQTLANDCLDDRNALPKPLRAQIISLSMWIVKYSKKVMRERASLDPLIEINRTIMQGLQDAA
jgi:flagellar protein FlaF